MTPVPGLDQPSTTGEPSLADFIPRVDARLAQLTEPFGDLRPTPSTTTTASAPTAPADPFSDLTPLKPPTVGSSPAPQPSPAITQAVVAPASSTTVAPVMGPSAPQVRASPTPTTSQNPFADLGQNYHQMPDPASRPTGDTTLDQAAHTLAPTQQRGIVARIGSALWDQEKSNVQFLKTVLLGGGPMNPDGVARAYRQLDPESQKQFQDGAAFTASTVASMLAPEVLGALKIPGASTLLGKALAFEATNAAGGATFGALQHLEPGQTRSGAIAGQAAGQVVMGTIAGGLGLGLNAALTKMGLVGSAVEKAVAETPATELMTPEVKAEAATLAPPITPTTATRTGATGQIRRIDELAPLGGPDRVTLPTNIEKVPDDNLLTAYYQRLDGMQAKNVTMWTREDVNAVGTTFEGKSGVIRSGVRGGAQVEQARAYIEKLEGELTRRGFSEDQLSSLYSDWVGTNRAKGPPTPEIPPTETVGATGRVTMAPGAAPTGPTPKAGAPPAVPPPPVPPTAADVPHAWGGDGNPPSDSPLRALRQKLSSLRDDQLSGLSAAVDAAPIVTKNPHLLARTLLGVTGAGTIGYAQNNDDLSPGERALLTGVGGLLIGASFVGSPTLKAAAQRIGLLRNTVGAIDGSALLTGGSKEAVQSATEIANLGERAGQSFREAVDGLIPDPALNRAARYVLDEPNSPEAAMFANRPEMAHLRELQKLFQGYKTLLQNTTRLDGTPLLAEAQENYLPRSGIVPRQDLGQFVIGGMGGGIQSGGITSSAGFMRQRTFDTLRELETHLRANGMEPNDQSLGQLVGHYVSTAQRVLANNAIKTELARIGLLLPGPETISTAHTAAQLVFDNGVPWRTVRVGGVGDMIAPETVASALEDMATAKPSQWAGYLGDLKSLSMRAIMLNPAIHSVNALRGALAAGVSPSGAVQAWRAIANNDPRILEAASYGLMTTGHPDLLRASSRAGQAFEAVVSNIPGGPVLRSLVNAGGRAMKWGDKILWDRIIPTLGQATYDLRMSKWADQTGGKFGVGSPEYVQAARAAARFANDQMGKIPDMLQSGDFQRLARNVLFAPKWLQTRMRLSAAAMGELTDVLTGELNPRNAAYLQAKVRQAVIAVGGTYALSKMLTGQAPEFNDRNAKFYAKTGISNGRGSEFGVDMNGWYQDDQRMFNAPFQYAAGKLNPILRVAGETVNGRDWAGRSMTGAERVENAINGLGGPVGQAVTLGARAATGGEANVRSGLDAASALTGAGTFAALPRSLDVTIGNVAKRLLQQSAVPASDDRVFELSRLIRQNAYRGHGLIDKGVLEYLAYQRRTAEEQRPLTTLWERGKQTLRDLVR